MIHMFSAFTKEIESSLSPHPAVVNDPIEREHRGNTQRLDERSGNVAFTLIELLAQPAMRLHRDLSKKSNPRFGAVQGLDMVQGQVTDRNETSASSGCN